MYRLFIVDDERNIRIGLKAMIEREFPDQYSIHLAAGGAEALELYRAEKADILITDIRMPDMDGLELIQELSREEQPPAFIILSGYDDFQYAKEAITYKVREYLLKPIVREQLFHALIRVTDEMKQELSVSRELEQLQAYRQEHAADQLNYILLHPEMTPDEMERRCAGAGLRLLDSSYVTSVIESEQQNASIVHLWEEAPFSDRSILFEDKDHGLVLIASTEPELTEFFASLQEKHLQAWMGISLETSGARQVKDSYAQARQALKYRMLQTQPGSVRFYYREIRMLPKPQQFPDESIRRLANLLGTGRTSEIHQLWHEIMNVHEIKRHDISYLEQMSRLLNELVFDQVFTSYGEASVEILKSCKQIGYLYHSRTINDYIHDAEDLLLRLDGYIKDVREAHLGNAEMKAAVDYIGQNYDKPLNMATVSNHVSLNYSYFSEAFKHFTGMSFVPYLKKVRIEKSKELLEHTHRKVYEIAELVGFENVKQFNRVFRELEGLSPIAYREKSWIHRLN
ncbi:response regulator [Paenibacillus sp. SAF-054]|uniref:response regulator n=1 Tax=unclassified Paenibacillus TaxID=185978 RepID=UPI003F7ECF10